VNQPFKDLHYSAEFCLGGTSDLHDLNPVDTDVVGNSAADLVDGFEMILIEVCDVNKHIQLFILRFNFSFHVGI
jgi:hypothetical protein